MKKLNKSQIEGIRLVADFLVIGDITEKVMPKVMSAQQLDDFKKHMQQQLPQAFSAGAELNRQIKEVREVWKAELLKWEQNA